MDTREVKTIKGEYGTYQQYYLTEEELKSYRSLPPDDYWKTNSRPMRTNEFSKPRNKKNGA